MRLANDGRSELARAGYDATMLYRPKADKTYTKYPWTIQEFQIYRSRLPRYRRALLLYKSPNPNAAMHKAFFHSALAIAPIELAVVPMLAPHLGFLNAPPPESLRAFGKAHPVIALLMFATAFIISLGAFAYMRGEVIKSENDQRYYLWAEDRETGHRRRQ
jgi:hypothetical protein